MVHPSIDLQFSKQDDSRKRKSDLGDRNKDFQSRKTYQNSNGKHASVEQFWAAEDALEKLSPKVTPDSIGRSLLQSRRSGSRKVLAKVHIEFSFGDLQESQTSNLRFNNGISTSEDAEVPMLEIKDLRCETVSESPQPDGPMSQAILEEATRLQGDTCSQSRSSMQESTSFGRSLLQSKRRGSRKVLTKVVVDSAFDDLQEQGAHLNTSDLEYNSGRMEMS